MKISLTKLTVTLFFICNLTSTTIHSQVLSWAKKLGSVGTATPLADGHSITVDASGNVFTVGHFSGLVDFDPGAGTFTLASFGSDDVFISKLDALGNFVWVKQIGGTGQEQGYSVTLDASGNIFITGFFTQTCDFDPAGTVFNMTSAGNFDGFVCKLNSSGNFVWASQLGGTAGEIGASIALDQQGNVVTCGQFESPDADFDPGAGTYTLASNAGSWDVYVSKLDPAGNFIWAKQLGGGPWNGWDVPYSVKVDASNNVITAGYFNSTAADFDPGVGTYTFTPFGLSDMFVSKLDASGNFVWAKQMGGAAYDEAYGMDVDAAGNIYTTGYFTGTCDFDPGSSVYNLTPVYGNGGGGGDLPVVKLDASGNFVWARNMGGNCYSCIAKGFGIDVDASGNVYTTGFFQSFVDFDPGPNVCFFSVAGINDVFMSKLDASGNFSYGRQISGNTSSWIRRSNAIAVDAAGSQYITGWFSDETDFDPGAGTYTLNTTNSSTDAFVCKYDVCTGPTVTAVSSASVICMGQNVTLTAGGALSYSWSNGSSSQGILVSPTTTTTYSVTGTAFNGCYNSAVVTVSVNTCLGINVSGTNENEIQIYPNPTNGKLNILLSSVSENCNADLYDYTGRLILNEKINSGLSSLNIENEPDGIYFVAVKKGTEVIKITRIIKQ